MTDREENLRELGIDMKLVPTIDATAFDLEPNGFSGYGEYTPITIRSYTLPEHADLERNQSRD